MAVFPTVYIESTWTLCGVHVESMRSPHGVQRDSLKYSGLHGESTMDSVETPCGLSVDSSWISLDSMRTAALINLIKKNLMIFKNKCSERESNSDPFGRCTTARQTAELNGHVSIGLFRKYIMPTSRDTHARSTNHIRTTSEPHPQPHPPHPQPHPPPHPPPHPQPHPPPHP